MSKFKRTLLGLFDYVLLFRDRYPKSVLLMSMCFDLILLVFYPKVFFVLAVIAVNLYLYKIMSRQ